MRIIGSGTADLESEPCYEEELISQRNFRGGGSSVGAQIFLLITVFAGNGILSSAQATSMAVVKPAESGPALSVIAGVIITQTLSMTLHCDRVF